MSVFVWYMTTYIYILYIHSKLHKNVPDMLAFGTLHRPSIAIESAAGYLKIHEAKFVIDIIMRQSTSNLRSTDFAGYVYPMFSSNGHHCFSLL